MKKKILLFVMFFLLIPLFGCSIQKAYEGTAYYFGTVITISIKADKEDVSEHFENICNIFEHYDLISSQYTRADNNVYAINHSSDFVTVDEDLVDMLKLALELKEKTNGHFNVLVGNVANDYKDIIYNGKEALSNTLDYYIDEINNSNIIIDGLNVKIEGSAKIDLGAIAKGYALAKVKEYLQGNSITEYIINCGASSLAMGEKSGDYFIIGIKYDESNKLYIKNYDLGCASSNEQFTYIGEEKIHHIINPLTCLPSSNHEAVYLIGEDSSLLDAFSTAFMSMELADIRRICTEYNLYYIVYDNNDIVYKSIDGVYYDSKTYQK